MPEELFFWQCLRLLISHHSLKNTRNNHAVIYFDKNSIKKESEKGHSDEKLFSSFESFQLGEWQHLLSSARLFKYRPLLPFSFLAAAESVDASSQNSFVPPPPTSLLEHLFLPYLTLKLELWLNPQTPKTHKTQINFVEVQVVRGGGGEDSYFPTLPSSRSWCNMVKSWSSSLLLTGDI